MLSEEQQEQQQGQGQGQGCWQGLVGALPVQQAALQASQVELRPQPCCPAEPETSRLTTPSTANLPNKAAYTPFRIAQLTTSDMRTKASPNKAACTTPQGCTADKC